MKNVIFDVRTQPTCLGIRPLGDVMMLNLNLRSKNDEPQAPEVKKDETLKFQGRTLFFSELVITYTEEKVPPRGFLVINQYQSVRIGPTFEEMNPTSLPDLFKPLRTLNLREKVEKSKN